MRITFSTGPSRTAHSGINRYTARLVLLLIFLALLLIAFDDTALLRPVKGQVQAILAPLERVLTQTRIGARGALETVLGTSDLRRHVMELEQEVSELREANLRLQGLQTENDQLKVELGVRQTYGWVTTSATVVQSNAENGRRMVRIDRGRVDGIEAGMPVVSKEGGSPAALIGVVDVLYAQTADVLLITDYGSSISAHTTQPNRAKGLIIGQWQLGTRIKLVDVDPSVPLATNDYVVTSGLSKGLAADTPMAQIPANIPIGQVTEVERTNHVQSAEVLPFVDPDRVRNVWVITGQK